MLQYHRVVIADIKVISDPNLRLNIINAKIIPRDEGVSEETLKVYEIANPLHMSSTGLARYWKKYRQ